MLFAGLLPTVDVMAELILATALLGELSIIVAQIISRSVWGASILWSDEVAHLALSTLTFFGGAVAYRRCRYTSVAVATNMLPERGRKIFATAASDSLVLPFSALVLLFSSVPLILSNWTQVTPVLELPASIIDLPFRRHEHASCAKALYAIDRMWRAHRHVAFIIGIAVAILAVTVQFAWPAWLGSDICNLYVPNSIFCVPDFCWPARRFRIIAGGRGLSRTYGRGSAGELARKHDRGDGQFCSIGSSLLCIPCRS